MVVAAAAVTSLSGYLCTRSSEYKSCGFYYNIQARTYTYTQLTRDIWVLLHRTYVLYAGIQYLPRVNTICIHDLMKTIYADGINYYASVHADRERRCLNYMITIILSSSCCDSPTLMQRRRTRFRSVFSQAYVRVRRLLYL